MFSDFWKATKGSLMLGRLVTPPQCDTLQHQYCSWEKTHYILYNKQFTGDILPSSTGFHEILRCCEISPRQFRYFKSSAARDLDWGRESRSLMGTISCGRLWETQTDSSKPIQDSWEEKDLFYSLLWGRNRIQMSKGDVMLLAKWQHS